MKEKKSPIYCDLQVENFTVSFSDGRALCCLLHHYHPALLPLDAVHFRTTQSLQEAAEAAEEGTALGGEDDSDLSQDWGAGNLGGEAMLSFGVLFFCGVVVIVAVLLLSWMFGHDCLDICCFGCLICMCFVFLFLHLFSAIEHVLHGKAH